MRFCFLWVGLFLALSASVAVADPLTPAQIRAFDITNLSSRSFDKRMTVFRIIKHQKWQKKYRGQAVAAIKKMLTSNDVKYLRTGMQGAVLLGYSDPGIRRLVYKLTKAIYYKSGSQYFYLRQWLIEYMQSEMQRGWQTAANLKIRLRICKVLLMTKRHVAGKKSGAKKPAAERAPKKRSP